jgi:hypothetical protein
VIEVVRRYDPQGNLVWHHEDACGGTPRSITITRFGDLVLGGITSSVAWLQQRDWVTLGAALAGSNGAPDLTADGYLDPSGQIVLSVDDALANAIGLHVIGFSRSDVPVFGGTLVPTWHVGVPFLTDALGEASLTIPLPAFIPLFSELYLQSWLLDAGAIQGFSATDAVGKAAQ